jgi:hypothetical protein
LATQADKEVLEFALLILQAAQDLNAVIIEDFAAIRSRGPPPGTGIPGLVYSVPTVPPESDAAAPNHEGEGAVRKRSRL